MATDVLIEGEALNNQGFEAYKTVEGLGLVTGGFLWPVNGIWGPGEIAPVTAPWVACGDD